MCSVVGQCKNRASLHAAYRESGDEVRATYITTPMMDRYLDCKVGSGLLCDASSAASEDVMRAKLSEHGVETFNFISESFNQLPLTEFR